MHGTSLSIFFFFSQKILHLLRQKWKKISLIFKIYRVMKVIHSICRIDSSCLRQTYLDLFPKHKFNLIRKIHLISIKYSRVIIWYAYRQWYLKNFLKFRHFPMSRNERSWALHEFYLNLQKIWKEFSLPHQNKSRKGIQWQHGNTLVSFH